jgi:hypothetical protein
MQGGWASSFLAISARIGECFSMETLTISFDDEIARRAKESAEREHKSISEWIEERIKFGVDRAVGLAALESRAVANGYPPGWLELYASLADDAAFVAPVRLHPFDGKSQRRLICSFQNWGSSRAPCRT